MATTNRTVSFVSHLEMDLDGGKVLPHALILGDVDNDGGNELIIGTTDGIMNIYQGSCVIPKCQVSGLGHITCISVGDVMHERKNSVTLFNTEGICYVYDFSRKNESCDPTKPSKDHSSIQFSLRHQQLFPANPKMLLLGDVDGDGKQELIMSHTDRIVSAYRFDSTTEAFTGLQEWKLRQSVGSITLHSGSQSTLPQIIASQPGCAYATLHIAWTLDQHQTDENNKIGVTDHLSYNPMSSLSRSQNPAISCQIVGNICKGSDCEKGYFALCTLDGNIKLIEDDEILWSFQVDHQLFAMNKLDVLGNRKEEVILCAWDGLTYIVDHDRNVVRFKFAENVQAFCAGQCAIEDGENVPCFVYADFRNKIRLYYDIQLPRLRITDFLTEADKDKEMKALFEEFGADTDKKKCELVRYCMYGMSSEIEEQCKQ